MAVDTEALAGHDETSPTAVERVGLAAPMTERLVLHPASTLIQHLVGEAHDVERVRDLDGVREHRVEHRLVGRREIQRRPCDPGPPRLRSGGEPGGRPRRVAPGDDVEELPAAHVDDLGRPSLPSERAVTGEQGLVQPERVHGARTGQGHQRAAGRTAPPRPSPCASPSSSHPRPPRPSGRDGRPATSPTGRLVSSTRSAPTRSADPARSSTCGTPGNAIAACATPAGPADRTPADRPARPRGHHGDAPDDRSMTVARRQS